MGSQRVRHNWVTFSQYMNWNMGFAYICNQFLFADYLIHPSSLTSLVAQTVKNLPTKRETIVQSLGWEDLLEKDMATHSSILAWKKPIDGGAWWATVHGVAKSRTWLRDFTFTFTLLYVSYQLRHWNCSALCGVSHSPSCFCCLLTLWLGTSWSWMTSHLSVTGICQSHCLNFPTKGLPIG